MAECKDLQWEVSVTSSLSCLYIQYKRGTEEEEKKRETIDKEKEKKTQQGLTTQAMWLICMMLIPPQLSYQPETISLKERVSIAIYCHTQQ
jgi:hypothetical protein